jgi:hypothetical protein
MKEKLLNIILFIIVSIITVAITPIIALLVILFGSFILSYFVTKLLVGKIYNKDRDGNI